MDDLSHNYHLRKSYLQRGQVPTQTMIKTKMSPALASIYFNSMTPKLKVIAGLDPPLKGGGSDWYVAPEDILKGRSVLKPVSKKILSKLNHHGIELIGTSIFIKHRKFQDVEKDQALTDSDSRWRNILSTPGNTMTDELAAIYSKKNTDSIKHEFKQFTRLYRESLRKIENIFHESAIVGIKRTQENAIASMQSKHSVCLKHQAKLVYDLYEKKLMDEKLRLRSEFVKDLEKSKKDFVEKIHDINVEKHTSIRKLKHYFALRNLACQVYVALKVREEHLTVMKELQHKHQKQAKILTESLAMKNLEYHLELQKKRKRQKFLDMWKVKLCHVMKKFQTFVSYTLKMLPDHAEFFINIEKLMLLQLNDALEDPSAESIFTRDEEQFVPPVPQAMPFYIFCDQGYRAHLDQNLCPKHGGTSSASLMPAIVINGRFLYANCDNFDLFMNKIKEYIHGNRGDDADMKDDTIYENLVPVSYTSSQQLKEIQLESSLLRILNDEIIQLTSETSKDTDVCDFCQIPLCLCTYLPSETKTSRGQPDSLLESKSAEKRSATCTVSSGIKSLQDHEREPKWESYFSHVEPLACSCSKTAKKHLEHNFPVYMRQMKYQPPDLPDYEMCSFGTLKALVQDARKDISPYHKSEPEGHVKTRKDKSTQYTDPEFEGLCNCWSVSEVQYLLKSNSSIDLKPQRLEHSHESIQEWRLVGSDVSPTFITKEASEFAISRARSLRNLLGEIPELDVIFKRKDCSFD